VSEITREVGISEATFYRCEKNVAGLGVAKMHRLKQLEDENKKLTALVADLSLTSRCFGML